jgi:hypothetical protein
VPENKADLGETKTKELEKTTQRQLRNMYFIPIAAWVINITNG